MHSKLVFIAIVVCLLQLSNVVLSVEAAQKPTDHKSTKFPFDLQKLFFDLQKFDFNELRSIFNEELLKKYPPSDKFELTAPGWWDYGYLVYDIADPIRAYLNEEITKRELCKRLFGAVGGLGGSVVGTAVGSFGGTLLHPGVGTFSGVLVGGQYGYKYGKEIANEFIGESICDSLT